MLCLLRKSESPFSEIQIEVHLRNCVYRSGRNFSEQRNSARIDPARLGPNSDTGRTRRQMPICDLHQFRDPLIEQSLVFSAEKSGQDEILVLVGDVEGPVVDSTVEDVRVDRGAPSV